MVHWRRDKPRTLLGLNIEARRRELGLTVVMVTHDVDEAVLLSDRIVMMTNGPAATIGEILKVDLPRPRHRVELAEERLRLLSLVTYGAVAFICLSAGLVFLAVFLTVLLWDSNRLLALGIFSALFLGGGIVALMMASLFLLIAPGVMMGRLQKALLEVELRSQIQSWHLRKLLPDEAQPPPARA